MTAGRARDRDNAKPASWLARRPTDREYASIRWKSYATGHSAATLAGVALAGAALDWPLSLSLADWRLCPVARTDGLQTPRGSLMSSRNCVSDWFHSGRPGARLQYLAAEFEHRARYWQSAGATRIALIAAASHRCEIKLAWRLALA